MSARPTEAGAPHGAADAERAGQAVSLPPRPDTPCVAVCSTTFDDVCRGGGRTVVEVAHWVSMNAADKELVWQRILA